jgi:hypothetical protein
MDHGQLLWTSEGLYYSDSEHDYLLGEQAKSWPSSKAHFQEFAFNLSDGTRFSLYNSGYDKTGYREDAVSNNGSASTVTPVLGYNEIAIPCGSTVFGIAEVSGDVNQKLAQRLGIIKKPSQSSMPQMLTRLYPRDSRVADNFVAAIDAPETNYMTRDAVCSGSTIHYFVKYGSQPDQDDYIASWDTATGRESHVPVRDLGSAIPGDIHVVRTANTLTPSGELLWLGTDGLIRSTSVNSGNTHTLWRLGTALDPDNNSLARFIGTELYFLQVPTYGADADIVLRRYDAISGGSGEVVARIPLVNKGLSTDLVLRDFAVSPEAG